MGINDWVHDLAPLVPIVIAWWSARRTFQKEFSETRVKVDLMFNWWQNTLERRKPKITPPGDS